MKPDAAFNPQPARKSLSYRVMMIIGFSVVFALFALSYSFIFEPSFTPVEIVELPFEDLPLSGINPLAESLNIGIQGAEGGETAVIDASVSNKLSIGVCAGRLELDKDLRLEIKYPEGISFSAVSCSLDSAAITLSAGSMLIVIDSGVRMSEGMSFNVQLQFRLGSAMDSAVFDCVLYNGDEEVLAGTFAVKAE